MSVTELFKDTRHKKAKRAGRGIAANLGKTAGRGTKGQKARSGAGRKIKAWFEGGQTPVFRKLAKKRGTNNKSYRIKPIVITTDIINAFYKDGEVVSIETLIAKNILRNSKKKAGVKVVLRSALQPKVTFDGVTTSKSLQ